MTRIVKLYEKVSANPGAGLAFRDFERLLRAFGFTWDRTVGSHRQYTHPRVPRSFPVQPTGKDAKRYQIRELLDIVEQHRLSMDE